MTTDNQKTPPSNAPWVGKFNAEAYASAHHRHVAQSQEAQERSATPTPFVTDEAGYHAPRPVAAPGPV